MIFSSFHSDNIEPVSSQHMQAFIQYARRLSIYYVYNHLLHCPPKACWREQRVIQSIMEYLKIPTGSYASVAHTLECIVEANSRNEPYDGLQSVHTRGRQPLIHDGDDSSNIIANCISSGLSLNTATIVVNEYSNVHRQDKISVSTVERCVARSPCFRMHHRQHQKSGKSDSNSTWSKSRLQQRKQIKKFKFKMRGMQKIIRLIR